MFNGVQMIVVRVQERGEFGHKFLQLPYSRVVLSTTKMLVAMKI
jgi:hypothetical protein